MESVHEITISCLKMMVKSGQEKIFLKILHAEAIFFYFILLHGKEDFTDNHKFSNKSNHHTAQ